MGMYSQSTEVVSDIREKDIIILTLDI